MRKLVQISTKGCPPCRMAKSIIHEKFVDQLDNYHYVDATNPDDLGMNLMSRTNVQRVPHFVVYNEETDAIESEFRGLSFMKIKGFFESL